MTEKYEAISVGDFDYIFLKEQSWEIAHIFKRKIFLS